MFTTIFLLIILTLTRCVCVLLYKVGGSLAVIMWSKKARLLFYLIVFRKGVKIENVFYNDDFYNDIALIKLAEKVTAL